MQQARVKLKLFCVLWIVGVSGVSMGNQNAPVADLSLSASKVIDERLRAFIAKRHIPGLAVAVGRGDRILWSAFYGVADLETRLPVNEGSAFPLGSTSKPLTSLLLGQLIERGKIDLDAPVQTFVPYFPKKTKPLNIRHLAGHLSGIRDYDHSKGEYENTNHFPNVRKAVEVFADDPLLFDPGSRYAYSAYNFVLLSAVIEGAAGADFLQVLKSNLTAPLAPKHTGPNRSPIPGLVKSYSVGILNKILPAKVGDPSNKWAAGGLVSTPTEMVRIGNAILAGRVVKPETFDLLTTPQTLADGTDSGEGYGMVVCPLS